MLSVSDGPCSIMILDLSPSGEIIVTVSNTAGREDRDEDSLDFD